MEKERLGFPYDNINPLIKPDTVTAIFKKDALSSMHEKISEIHPDFNKCAYTFSSIRKTFYKDSFDPVSYQIGLKTFLNGRNRELGFVKGELLEPYAIDFVRDLLRTSTNIEIARQARSLTEKITTEFETNPFVIPELDLEPYQKLADMIQVQTKNNLTEFKLKQPYIMIYLSTSMKDYRGDKTNLQSMATGIIDGTRMFSIEQNKLYTDEFGNSGKIISDFFKDKPPLR